MLRSVLVVPQYRAPEFKGDPASVLIAVANMGEKPRNYDGWADALHLAFSDATRRSPTVKLFSEEDAAAVRAFCTKWHHVPTKIRVVVSCEYGMSRSAAIGLCISRAHKVPIETLKHAVELAQERPLPVDRVRDWGVVTPNKRVLEILYPQFLQERAPEDYTLMLLKQNTVAELVPIE